jgi:outer membrane protein OmpA-like peptidoglycan-associated protein/tetratricopeptide (TPR) repeat protein
MKKALPLLFFAILFSFCSEEKKMLRKASNAVDQSNFDQAISYYDKILQKNDKSFFGNAGKGIVLSEFQARHEQAIPYLEKALANSPDKSKPIIQGNLGKSYHFIGNYKRALEYYGKLDNDPKFNDFDEFLTKRIADCKYAIEHPDIATAENQDVRNVGNVINTDKPEYTPVYSNGVMYFTSKRQDDAKEKKNGIDGKYFESIYTSKLSNGSWSTPQKFDLPKGFQMRKYGEAVASISPDGQKLFIYKAGKIYETDVNNTEHMKEMDKNINSAGLMNHAALSPDGKTMYFTSESTKGSGGSDIYVTTKKDDGTWEDPRGLEYTVNTSYDEEAPFVTADGVLYFASNGHPGYGGFDIYKTQKVNGSWTKPENLGQPINSPGDDIFFTLLNNTSNGYYASARPGGFGDLDIYHVHYLRTENVECKPTEVMAINATPELNNPLAYNIGLDLPENMKSSVRSYRWEINGKALPHTQASFQHTFDKPDDYKVNARIISYCDTCPTLNAYCAEKNISIKTNILASNETGNESDKLAANEKGRKNDKKGKNQKDKKTAGDGSEDGTPGSDKQTVASNSQNDNNTGDNSMASSGEKSGKGKKGDKNAVTNRDSEADEDNTRVATNKNTQGRDNDGDDDGTNTAFAGSNSYMSDDKLREMNWNVTPVYFDYGEASLRADSKSVLDGNIQIIKNTPGLSFVISGYADSRGSSEFNKQLSLKRANSVKEYLLNNGVSRKSIKAVKGLGETQLVNNCTDDSNCDDAQHQQNRRVKVDVIDRKQPVTLK